MTIRTNLTIKSQVNWIMQKAASSLCKTHQYLLSAVCQKYFEPLLRLIAWHTDLEHHICSKNRIGFHTHGITWSSWNHHHHLPIRSRQGIRFHSQNQHQERGHEIHNWHPPRTHVGHQNNSWHWCGIWALLHLLYLSSFVEVPFTLRGLLVWQ